MALSETIDARDLIENYAIGHWQVITICLITLASGFDGLTNQLMTYVSMNIAKEWHISMASVGTVFGISMAGTVVGAFTLGALGDMVGLKRMLVAVTIVVGLATVATGFATSWTQFIVLLFMTGLGVGGAIPNLIALTAQFTPLSSRRIYYPHHVRASIGGRCWWFSCSGPHCRLWLASRIQGRRLSSIITGSGFDSAVA